MTTAAGIPLTELSALQSLAPYRGAVAVPASGSTPLVTPTRGLVVHTAGNLGVIMADGSSTDAHLVAVTAGMIFPYAVTGLSASNTAGVWGLI